MLFPFSSHCDVIGSDKLRRRLINIYELIWNVVLKDFIGNFVKKLWSHFSPKKDQVIAGLNVVTARRENYILWYNDRTYDLVTLKSIYLPNLSGFARIKPFSTPETTWMLIPPPANRRFKSIERNLRLSTSSIRNGRPPFFFCFWFFVTF